jgi:cell division septum initiation protein DivIVA
MDEMSAITALNEAWAKVQEEAGRAEALQKKIDQLKKNEAELNQKVTALAEQSATAQKSVSDAQKQATKIVADAQQEAARIRGEAMNDKVVLIEKARIEAAGLVSKAKGEADKITVAATTLVKDATEEARIATEKARLATINIEKMKQQAKSFAE